MSEKWNQYLNPGILTPESVIYYTTLVENSDH